MLKCVEEAKQGKGRKRGRGDAAPSALQAQPDIKAAAVKAGDVVTSSAAAEAGVKVEGGERADDDGTGAKASKRQRAQAPIKEEQARPQQEQVRLRALFVRAIVQSGGEAGQPRASSFLLEVVVGESR